MPAEVIIIGAGPGGMSAAIALAKHDISVRVIDEQSAPGGQVFRAMEKVHENRPDDLTVLGEHYAAGAVLVKQFRESGAHYMPETAVWELDADASAPKRIVRSLHAGKAANHHADHVLLATGAMERPTPFSGWTLPGVMTVGAAQTMLKSSGLLPDGRVVLAGSGPLLQLFCWQLMQAGLRPDRILDTGTKPSGSALRALPAALRDSRNELIRGWQWMRQAKRSGIRTESRITGLRALGEDKLQAIEFARGNDKKTIEADLLLVHDGVIPNTWLAMSVGCDHQWNDVQQCWEPSIDDRGASNVNGISIIGDAAGIGGSELAQVRGRLAALAIAQRLGKLDASKAQLEFDDCRHELKKIASLRRFLDRFFTPADLFIRPSQSDTIVCRCEEVTVGQLREVASLGVVGPNQGKAFTRCGMGPCMGRKCGPTVSRLIADFHGLPMNEVGHYRIRPPVKPITVGELADLEFDGDEPNG